MAKTGPGSPHEVEFDILMQRAGIAVKPEWREQMMLEFSQLRADMDVIHELANAFSGHIDVRQTIVTGRVET